MSRVLLIEDDDQVMNLFSSVLKKNGYDVLAAANGAEGLRILEQCQVDLIITDIIMPELDGFEVILSMIDNKNRSPIIVISGGSTRLRVDELLNTARLMKADLVLQKPITGTQLVEAVETVLLSR